jgi:hypothetical protein
MVTQMSFKNFSSGFSSKPKTPANDRPGQGEMQDRPVAPGAKPPAEEQPAGKD